MRLFIFLLLIICQSINCFGQIIFKDPGNPLHYIVDLKTQVLLKESRSGKFVSIGHLKFRSINILDIPNNPTIFSYPENSTILLTVEGTGQVYRMNTDSLIFERLDKTFFRGYNFAPIQFLRKDTIHSIGGNGFWHAHNIETYYSIKNNEWELINAPSEDSPKWMKNDFGGYDLQRDLISVIEFPSIYHNSNQNSSMRYFEKKFTDRKWEYKGDLNSKLLFSLGLKTLNSTFISGKYLFFNGSILVWANPANNEISQLKNVDQHFNSAFEYSAKDDMIYSYYHEKIGDHIRIDSISLSNLEALSVIKGPFYIKSDQSIDWILITLILGLFSILFYFVIFTKRKIEPREEKELEGFPEGGKSFLISCLNHPNGHKFTSQVFTEMMGYSSYAYETQRQVRSKLIKNINSYFWVHYRMEDVIIRNTAKEDKRFSVYHISEEHYEFLKKLLTK